MNRFIKIICLFLISFILFGSICTNAKSNDKKVTIYFFHGNGCPHCAEEEEFFNKLKKEYNIKIVDYEVWYNDENAEAMQRVKDRMGIKDQGVPLTIIGTHYIVGYSDSKGNEIKRTIAYYQKNKLENIVPRIINSTLPDDYEIIDKVGEEEKNTGEQLIIKVPIFGKVNLKNISIFMAVLIGLVDGFNPCAMWILLFLLSVLIGLKNKKKMWIYGLSFLLTSALVYMLIMFSWITIVVKVTTSILIRNIIAIIAIIGGIINLYNYHKSKDSVCNVVNDKKRKKIFTKIKEFTNSKSFIIGLIGIIGLAISVNLVELACSAGLPLVFTQLLTINNITGGKSFFYILIYIVFFLLDDLIVFFIAMFTFNLTGISTKFNKYSHIIGGILMLLIGGLMLFKPEWLMFQFK